MTDFQTKTQNAIAAWLRDYKTPESAMKILACNLEGLSTEIAAALAAAYEQGKRDEREACARVIEDHPGAIKIDDDKAASLGRFAREAGPRDYAAAIRKRGEA